MNHFLLTDTESVVLFDDSGHNIQEARAMGAHGIQVDATTAFDVMCSYSLQP